MRTSLEIVSPRRSSWRYVLALLVCVLSLPVSVRSADQIWTNVGVITFPPQIDAVTFVNYGIMDLDIFSNLPFETSNTRYYTNYGTMSSSPGFVFHTAPTLYGQPVMASSFANMGGGVIEGLDPSSFFVASGTEPGSYLWVTATNILNRGLLSVGANGWMKLNGSHLDLSRSGLDVTSIVPRGSTRIGTNDFIPDAGIADVLADGTNSTIVTSGIWNGTIARVPTPQYGFALFGPFADSISNVNGGITVTVTNIVGITNITETTLTNLSETNIVVEEIFIPTNITRQAAFVTVGDPSRMGVEIGWIPSTNPTNFYFTSAVHIYATATNVVSGLNELNHLYLYDFLASDDPRGLATNLLYGTAKPVNYVLSRLNEFGMGQPGDGYPEADYLYQSDFSNAVVTADWSFYWANVSYLPTLPPLLPQATYTNLPGRIQITADTLDLTRTRVRGQGQVSINANHIISTTNSVIDSPNLAFDLSSTNNQLRVSNLAKSSVDRFGGDLLAYSAVWLNSYVLSTESWSVTATNMDTNGVVLGIDVTLVPLTNNIDVNLHVLLVSGDDLLSERPVFVWDANLKSAEVTLNDNMNVVTSFNSDAERLTINGSLSFITGSWSTPSGTAFFPPMQDWGSTNVPNLLYFTNNGTFSVANTALFGDSEPLLTFVNNGTISAFSLNVASEYFQESGQLSLGGPLWIEAGSINLEQGSSSAGSTFINGRDLKMNDYLFTASGNVHINVPGVFTDAGTVGSTNLWTFRNGFEVVSKAASGDLLATAFRSALPDFIETFHIWPASDFGASSNGFVNNMALGALQLNGTTFRPPLAVFRGATGNNALYVDLLDIRALGESFTNFIEIEPSITIYYAAAAIGFDAPDLGSGIRQTPEEYLDGQFGGRLQWVPEFAGPRSSAAVVLNGETVFMNLGLRNSQILDSDGDGIPNFFDTTPLGGTTQSPLPGTTGLVGLPSLFSPAGGGNSFSLSWNGAANTTYVVEVSESLTNPDWQLLQTIVNTSSVPKALAITDPIAGSGNQRFYRIRVQP